MNLKTLIKYLTIYLFLTAIGLSIASNFWWTDRLKLSSLGPEMLSLLFSVAICWIGILYLSILIIRRFIVRIDYQNFIGPIDLLSNERHQKEVDIKKATQFKNALGFVAFPILGFTIIAFITAMKQYEIYDLNKNGLIENVFVKEIRKDIKQNEYLYFQYNNGKSETNLPNEKKLRIGDPIKVIYSKRNPKIINYFTVQ